MSRLTIIAAVLGYAVLTLVMPILAVALVVPQVGAGP